jgi:hypothetical protein
VSAFAQNLSPDPGPPDIPLGPEVSAFAQNLSPDPGPPDIQVSDFVLDLLGIGPPDI